MNCTQHILKPAMVLVNRTIDPGRPHLPLKDIERGVTISQSGHPMMVPCMKCTKCGHSVAI